MGGRDIDERCEIHRQEKNMKVLIISAFPPDPAPEANHALHISEQLAKSGHTVHVLCKKGSITPTHENIVVHPVVNNWLWADLPTLSKRIKSCRPDVVLLLYIGWIFNHHPMITFLPTICKTIVPSIPCVTQFEIIDPCSPRRSLKDRLLRKMMMIWVGRRDADWLFGTLLLDSARTIVLSSPHRDRLLKHHPEIAEKTVVLPPPPLIRFCQDLASTVRKRTRSIIGAAENEFVLVYWGYIYPGKGVETLLQAFRIICRENRNMRLVLVGGSLEMPEQRQKCIDYFQMVRDLPDQLGIAEQVTWTGHFNWDSDEGSRYLHAGDACVLPFDYGVTLNNSSLAAASTHGLPVISTELSVGRDEALEHGQNIYLCRPRDPEMLAEAIQMIRDDPDMRERLRLGALSLARDWHRWEPTTERLIGVLESAVSCGKVSGQEQTQSYVATNEAELNKKRISSDMGLHSCDDALPGVQENNPGLSSLISSRKNTPENVNDPLVSVIVAVHNIEKYLRQCLDSLVNQTLTNIEIIVVNDASTDGSAQIINSYKSTCPNLRIINCEFNKGLASVRNIGLRAAKGQYVAFADGDDWVDVRMCEVLYRRASKDDADVVIADATVFYEDSKKFCQFFDQPIRKALGPQLKAIPFGLLSEPRVLLLEPVAWTKLYRRAFLHKHAIEFEDGMNSYEDICFHFSVLLKATSISLLDDVLFFYRQNRPGQISGRTSRKIFEVFAVFQKIQENLAAWEVSADVWAMLIKVQLRQFNWLLRDRVQSHHKQEFMASVASQFKMIPESGFQHFAQHATADESSTLFCMQRNWSRAYEQVSRNRWYLSQLLSALLKYRMAGVLKRGYQHGLGMLRQRFTSEVRRLINKAIDVEAFEKAVRIVNERLNVLTSDDEDELQRGEPLVEVCRIDNQVFFLSRPSSQRSGLGDAKWRMENDHYLTRTAIFREGDTIVDVGAHLGVISVYLAKKYPFIKVYAIEPDPVKFRALRRNIELNGLTNVIAINKGVSGDGQKKTLYVNARHEGSATIDPRVAFEYHTLRSVQVDTLTLDQLCHEYAIRHCRLLKITAPGAVKEILKGFTRSGCVDLLCGEVDLADCSRVKLETASWRIARQHFWRTTVKRGNGTVYSWIHQTPTGWSGLKIGLDSHLDLCPLERRADSNASKVRINVA